MPSPQGKPRANIWEGQFPWECRNPGGVFGTTAVRTYPPNEYGLYTPRPLLELRNGESAVEFFTRHLSPVPAPVGKVFNIQLAADSPSNPDTPAPLPTRGQIRAVLGMLMIVLRGRDATPTGH